MAARLTSFSKLLITLLILTGIFFGGRYVLQNTSAGKEMMKKAEEIKQQENAAQDTAADTPARDKNDNVLRVQLVTWGGYAPGLFFNEGALANTASQFYKDYGFQVEFRLENNLDNALGAWMTDNYDILVQTADAFPLYTSPAEINNFKPKAFMQVDWSRGGDAIIAKRGIKTINDLKGKKIAVAVPSPAQTLLISSLEAAGLKYEDVTVVTTPDNLKAAELFRSKDIDAAVVWSPDDILATRDVPGSSILVTTKEQSHIIADIMFAKESFILANKEKIQNFYEGWMKGVAAMKDPNNRRKAAKYLAELNDLSTDDALGMMDNVYFTSHEDNVNFFGLNDNYRGQKGQDLYEKMSREFVKIGNAETQAPAWRSVIYTGAISGAASNLIGATYAAEGAKKFESKPTDTSAPAIASKPIRINFETAQFKLNENAKTIIDLQFADIAKTFANTKVRIEGNTDNVGQRNNNVALSKKRAQSVADYLISEYNMDPKRIIIVGNGPDKPVQGCESNASEDCKAKNRRTEFQLIQD